MFKLFIFLLIIEIIQHVHSFPTKEHGRSKSDNTVAENNVFEERNVENDIREEDSNEQEAGFLSRIVPEFQFPDLLKPIQVQIPILRLPELPSYSLSLSK